MIRSILIFFILMIFSISPVESGIRSYVFYVDNRTAYFSGYITESALDYFEIYENEIDEVVLDSNGGLLWIAAEIAKLIRKHNIATTVLANKSCSSACTVVFQAGGTRTAYSNSRFYYHYVHTVNINNDGSEVQILNVDSTNKMFRILEDEYNLSPKIQQMVKERREITLNGIDAIQYNIINVLIFED